MFHFIGNPTCSVRTSDTEARVSRPPDLETFRDCDSINPRYCAECADVRSDSDRYAELRKIVEEWQSHITGSSQALRDWSHR